jgi:hypothetical protein
MPVIAEARGLNASDFAMKNSLAKRRAASTYTRDKAMAPEVLDEAALEATATVLRANWRSALTGMVVDSAPSYSAAYAAEEDGDGELAPEADEEELAAEAEEEELAAEAEEELAAEADEEELAPESEGELAVGASATRITGAPTSWITGAATSRTSLMPCGGSALLSISSVARTFRL